MSVCQELLRVKSIEVRKRKLKTEKSV